MSKETHYTAWVVNDPTCLDTGCMDVTVLQDEISGYRTDDEGNETAPIWSTDSSQPTAFQAVTTVDAADGDVKDAITEAEALMGAAGWATVGEWEALDNAYVATAERIGG